MNVTLPLTMRSTGTLLYAMASSVAIGMGFNCNDFGISIKCSCVIGKHASERSPINLKSLSEIIELGSFMWGRNATTFIRLELNNATKNRQESKVPLLQCCTALLQWRGFPRLWKSASYMQFCCFLHQGPRTSTHQGWLYVVCLVLAVRFLCKHGQTIGCFQVLLNP